MTEHIRYFALLVGSSIGLCLIVFCINVFFDPLWYITGNQLEDLNYMFNERLSKTNQFIKRRSPQTYNCIIFGSSRTILLNESRLEAPYRCFNFSFSGGRIQEFVAFAKWLKKRGEQPEYVILGIDDFNFVELDTEHNIPKFVTHHSDPPNIFYSYFLTTINNLMLFFLLLLLPTSLLYSVSDILLTATRAVKIVRYEVVAKSIIEPYSLTILSVILFYAGFSEYGLFIAYWLMNISVLCYTIYIYLKTIACDRSCLSFRFNPFFSEIGAILKRSFPVAIDDILMVLMLRVDVYLLGVLAKPEMLGIYGICLQVITIVKKIKQSFDPILEPVIAQSVKIENLSNVANELARVSNLIFWIQSMIFTFLLFYSDELLLLFDIEGSVASLTLLFLIFSVVVSSAFGLSELIFLNKKPAINFHISTFTLLIHLVLSYLLISRYGILGAGLAMAISYGLRSFIQLYLMKRIYKVFPLNWSILMSLGGCLLLFSYLFLINNLLDISSAFNIVLGIIGGLVIYISYGYFVKLLNNQF